MTVDMPLASQYSKSSKVFIQCLCLPLHEACDPATCPKAPSREKRNRRTSRPKSSASQWDVECALSALRIASLQGCFTCGIYYAGLSIPSGFIFKGDEDEVQVRIKDNGAHVSAFNSANDFLYDDLELYTTEKSGQSGLMLALACQQSSLIAHLL